ncbi:hypothetical protein I4U23_024066 [Adineta vaga]|nr:hypothetical protein I4U23_024066 [Adineta vaga]
MGFGLAATDDNKIIIVGGHNFDFESMSNVTMLDTQAEEFKWQNLPDMPNGTIGPGVSVIDNNLYVIGGFDFIGHEILCHGDVLLLNLDEKQWKTLIDIHPPRARPLISIIDHVDPPQCFTYSALFIAGGYNFDKKGKVVPYGKIEEYNRKKKTWQVIANIPNFKTSNGLATKNHKLLLMDTIPETGENQIIKKYNFATRQWQSSHDLRQSSIHHRVGVLIESILPLERNQMGSKLSRRHSEAGEQMSKEMIDDLCEQTGFSEEELLKWHSNFYKDCPDGRLTLKQFEHEYSKIMGKPTQKTVDYVKHMFNVYDKDKNQFIDFKEFVMALSAASVVNRLRLVETIFSIFDLDNDGRITKDEMTQMLHTLVEVTNSNKKRRQHNSDADDSNRQPNLQKRIDDAFNELNTNDDDHITKDEFIEWYMKTGLLTDGKSNGINVHDTSRIQHLDKKSRKVKKQLVNAGDHVEEHSHSQLIRHISHMIERRSSTTSGTDDENDGETTSKQRRSSDDSDSHYSKENERWQHLFNSVLGQIRAQRIENQEKEYKIEFNEQNLINHFDSWKKQGEEKLKVEYLRQKSSECSPSSPDVITIRF